MPRSLNTTTLSISKIIKDTKAAGLPEPLFEDKEGMHITFLSTPHVTPHDESQLSSQEIVDLQGNQLDYDPRMNVIFGSCLRD